MSELNPPSSAASLIRTDPTTRLAWSGLGRWQAPIWLKLSAVAFVVATWLPIAVFVEWRTDVAKPQPRIHLIQDMDNQTKYKAQDDSVLFNDRRADRPRVPGSVARGELHADVAYYAGYTTAVGADGKSASTFVSEFPDAVQDEFVDPARAARFLALGQQKFNITCATCHGRDGQGNGPTHVRAGLAGAGQTGWVQPSSLIDDVRRGRSDGHLYNSINVGIRNMQGYGTQLNAQERWAIVAYVRTLQLAQAAPKAVLSEAQQRALQ